MHDDIEIEADVFKVAVVANAGTTGFATLKQPQSQNNDFTNFSFFTTTFNDIKFVTNKE
jgi:hypothetical protein